jgi:Fe2+ transport system protein FeoA
MVNLQLRLDELEAGQQGTITKIVGDLGVRRRIMAMGVVRGARIRVVRSAPLGDPIEFELKDYNLSLRKNEARNVYVEVNK